MEKANHNDDGMIQTKICRLMFSLDCHKDVPSPSSMRKEGAAAAAPTNVLTYTCGRCGHSETDKSNFDLHIDSCRSEKPVLDPDPPKPSVIKINRSATKPVGFKLSGRVIDSSKVSESPSSHCEKPLHVHMQVIFNSPNVSKSHSCKSCREMPKSVLWFKAHENRDMKSYICYVCQATFIELYELIEHNGSHEEDVPYKCGVCGRCYETREDFKSHHQSHLSQIQCYRCIKCEKTFSQELCLKKHMRMHFQVKEHRCHLCEKLFSSKSQLDMHMYMHTGEKPYRCEFCDRGFSRNTFKLLHISRKHSGNSRTVWNGLEVSKKAGIKTLSEIGEVGKIVKKKKKNGLEVSKEAGIKTLSEIKKAEKIAKKKNNLEVSKEAGIKTQKQIEKVEKIVKKIRDMHSEVTVVKGQKGKKPKSPSSKLIHTEKRKRGRPPKILSQNLIQNALEPQNDVKAPVVIKIMATPVAKKEPKVIEKPNSEENEDTIPEPTMNSHSMRLRVKARAIAADSEKPKLPQPPIIIPALPHSEQEKKRKVETLTPTPNQLEKEASEIKPKKVETPTPYPNKLEKQASKMGARKSRREPKPRMLFKISTN